jgi:catechol 2,3-dioxygenase-like lactoylglutathione lyase family enzyme
LQIDRIDHLVLTVRDVDETVDFYRRVLGMKPVTFEDGRRALCFGRQKINLHQAGHEFEPKAAIPTPGSADLCLVTTGPIEEVLAQLAAADVAIEEGPVAQTGALGPMTSIYFQDLDGNLVEVASYLAPGRPPLVDVLVISGPAGVGKSSTAFEASDQLRAANVAHAVIDTDELDRFYPVPEDLSTITERNLAAIWEGYRERGCSRLILVGVYADVPTELEWIARAVPSAQFTLVRLVAGREALEERIVRREVGSGAAAQLERTTRQVADMEADRRPEVHILDTDGVTVEEEAQQVLALWRGSTG